MGVLLREQSGLKRRISNNKCGLAACFCNERAGWVGQAVVFIWEAVREQQQVAGWVHLAWVAMGQRLPPAVVSFTSIVALQSRARMHACVCVRAWVN